MKGVFDGIVDENKIEIKRSDAPKPHPAEGLKETLDKAMAYAKSKMPNLKKR